MFDHKLHFFVGPKVFSSPWGQPNLSFHLSSVSASWAKQRKWVLTVQMTFSDLSDIFWCTAGNIAQDNIVRNQQSSNSLGSSSFKFVMLMFCCVQLDFGSNMLYNDHCRKWLSLTVLKTTISHPLWHYCSYRCSSFALWPPLAPPPCQLTHNCTVRHVKPDPVEPCKCDPGHHPIIHPSIHPTTEK